MSEKEDTKRGTRVRRVLDSKRQPPEYQRLDMEPKEAGKSLLHDEFGMPKVTQAPKENIPIMKEIPNEPVNVKASKPTAKVRIAKGNTQRGMPSRQAEQTLQDDDKFIPPKSNFVSVGQSDHTWYDDKVAGPSERMIDNNEEMNIENLQRVSVVDAEKNVFGLVGKPDPLSQKVKNAQSKQFEARVINVFDSIKEQMDDITSTEDLQTFLQNVRAENGVLAKLFKLFKKIPESEKEDIGALIDARIQQFNIDFKAKEHELELDESEVEESEPEELEDDFQDQDNDPFVESSNAQSEDEEIDHKDAPDTAKISQTLKEGQYGILVDDKLFTVLPDAASAKQALTRLVLGNEVDLSRIQVIKRIGIDFGILLGD
jgi:Tfp pilus assembly protein PilP